MYDHSRLNGRLRGALVLMKGVTMAVMVAAITAACTGTSQIAPPDDLSASSTSHSQAADTGSAIPVTWTNTGAPLTGPHAVVVVQEPDLPHHTIYRPATLPRQKLPIMTWGNGGCSANGLAAAEFLAEIASHGYLVISNGVPNGSGEEPRDGSTHIAALDWATNANADSGSDYFHRLDADSIAVMGYSCGGLMSLNAAGDPRVSVVAAMNSGLLAPDQDVYARLHTPLAYFNGGEKDIAYQNGLRDYQTISHIPVYHANLPVGHGGTYGQDNGGEYARVSVAWLNWYLKNDQGSTGRKMFLGDDCGICNSDWVVEHKNF